MVGADRARRRLGGERIVPIITLTAATIGAADEDIGVAMSAVARAGG